VQGGVLTLAVIYVCVNFAADIVYMILNPRVKL
jgi:ABC-type dipeptide/oligopeptide/nickel transport system permease component